MQTHVPPPARPHAKLQPLVPVRACGFALTLGDVLFTSEQADLKADASSHLNKLVAFLGLPTNRWSSSSACHTPLLSGRCCV